MISKEDLIRLHLQEIAIILILHIENDNAL